MGPSPRSRKILKTILAGCLTCLLSPPGQAQTTKTKVPKAPVAAAPAAHDCGEGVTLRLTGSSVQQGGLLELTLAATGPVSEIKADWASSALPFWEDDAGLHHALLGVDLERAPGKYDLSITGQLASGAQLTCSAQVDVEAGAICDRKPQSGSGIRRAEPGRARPRRQRKPAHTRNLRDYYSRATVGWKISHASRRQ